MTQFMGEGEPLLVFRQPRAHTNDPSIPLVRSAHSSRHPGDAHLNAKRFSSDQLVHVNRDPAASVAPQAVRALLDELAAYHVAIV